mmetsp:Transcript_16144/g.44399  ORF Transcript_16144/g.44399 Transcript_16144/m.44399 type:complete len:353 (+) Transcript_16144:117-1175(+)
MELVMAVSSAKSSPEPGSLRPNWSTLVAPVGSSPAICCLSCSTEVPLTTVSSDLRSMSRSMCTVTVISTRGSTASAAAAAAIGASASPGSGCAPPLAGGSHSPPGFAPKPASAASASCSFPCSSHSRPKVSRVVRPFSLSASPKATIAPSSLPCRRTSLTWLSRVSPRWRMSSRLTLPQVLSAGTESCRLQPAIAWVTVMTTSLGGGSSPDSGSTAFGSLASGFFAWGLKGFLASGFPSSCGGAIAGNSRPRNSSSVLPSSISSSLKLEKLLPSCFTSLQTLKLRSSNFALMALRTSRMVAVSLTVTTMDCGDSEAACTTRTWTSLPSLMSMPVNSMPCSTSSSTELSIMSS